VLVCGGGCCCLYTNKPSKGNETIQSFAFLFFWLGLLLLLDARTSCFLLVLLLRLLLQSNKAKFFISAIEAT
jgi:hypothetical protein